MFKSFLRVLYLVFFRNYSASFSSFPSFFVAVAEPSSLNIGYAIGGTIIGMLSVGVIVLVPIYYKFRQVQERKLTLTLQKKIDNVTQPTEDGNMPISRSHKFGFGRHIIRPRTLFDIFFRRFRSNVSISRSRSRSFSSTYSIPYDVSSASS